MKPIGLALQFLVLGLSVAVFFTYIQPTFENINEIQNKIALYAEQKTNVSSFNAELAANVNTLDSVSPQDISRLETYLPKSLDSVSVLRDIQFIIAESGSEFISVEYSGESAIVDDESLSRLRPKSHEFSVSTAGSYSQIKQLLSLLEQNHYPLEVFELNLTAAEGGVMQASLRLLTYEDVEALFNEN